MAMQGLEFILPEGVKDKKVSVIEVGPFDESGKAKEINKFLGTKIEDLSKINTYVMVHPISMGGIETLLTGTPFVDSIVRRASLNSPLVTELRLPYDFVLQSMLNPGTSDMYGDTPLRQSLLKLGYKFSEGDLGILSEQHFLKGNLSSEQLEEVSGFLANPDLNTRLIISAKEYGAGKKVIAPVVTLKPEAKVLEFDVVNMSDEELLALNSDKRIMKLAATLEELQQFRDMYKDEEFLTKRREYGLSEKATDVELTTWFGLRSEHCFHKEFNAHITLEDKVNDPIFQRAFDKGYLKKNKKGEYVLEDGLFKTFIENPAKDISAKLDKRGNNWIASMFDDNSGVVYYNKDYMFCIKFETHNSPTNKEPRQGAKTGIDGVNRDIFGTMLGTFDAISNHFYYCTGNPDYKGWLPKGVKHPYVILKEETAGVREGGNESQIATLGGGASFDPRNIAKCLCYCGTIGWSPVKSESGLLYTVKSPKIGDPIFVSGQPVGVDGVGGGTESSLSASALISLGHVQADFSFIQAKNKGYILDVAKGGLLSDITDFGAMGLGSASHEIAKSTGGLDMDLSLHPVKYKGIQPWQINCSESQDRMLLVSRPENKEELLNRAKLHDVDVTELGKLTDSGYVHLTYGEKTVALIDIEKLFNKEPRKYMHATWNQNLEVKEQKIEGKYSLEESLCMVMERPDVASKEWFFRQKDSSVKNYTILGPLMGLKQEVEADATVQKPLDTEGKDNGAIAYAMGINQKLSDLDPYYSAQKSFLDMVGKIVAVGGALPDMKNPKWDAWAVCGNYCQPNSDSNTTLTKESGEHNLASLVREGIGVCEAEEATNIPVISGKDSMKCSCVYEVDKSFKLEDVPLDLRRHISLVEKEDGKRFIEIHDPDSYLASAAVKIDDYRKCVNSTFKKEGDLVYIVGTTKNHLGGSTYSEAVGYKEEGAPLEGGEVPQTDLKEFVKNANAIHAVIDEELLASCKYIHDDINTSIAKSAIAGEKGAEIDIERISQDGSCKTDEQLLYSGTPGRYVITVDPKDVDKFVNILMKHDVQYSLIGEIKAENLKQTRLDRTEETINLVKVKEHYQKPLSFGLNDLVK